jgi:hypothetical protein
LEERTTANSLENKKQTAQDETVLTRAASPTGSLFFKGGRDATVLEFFMKGWTNFTNKSMISLSEPQH